MLSPSIPSIDHHSAFSEGAVVAGVATFVASVAFQRDWVSRGKPVPHHYKEVAPPWAYKANAWITGTWTPIALVYAFVDSMLLMTEGSGVDFESLMLESRSRCDVHVFGAMFGIMFKDFFLFFGTPDIILLAHHLLVMFIACSLCFLPVQSLRMCTFCAIIVEIGSATYCSFIADRSSLARVLYKVGMTASNAIFFLAILFWYSANNHLMLSPYLVLAALGIVLGRQVVLVEEMKLEGKRQLAAVQ
eukprot:TRINITY_DN3116_c1_g1_i7.p1 TRINITY_DN3116_c1_g1~~TRINITY_DN3116_c1_g1_i7.p1  ORF type:complete len:246 (+),score=32.91 TRINITY_DN3116_c1_g1_i7:79-816(+)